ncbi:hypothetical protein D2Q93_14780 [Alicyclobacillaceae bacterium I2511]|nr:hypothetical protein D2Q93_14780 [Alicyclobacillaceae bacterium I2511]
MSLANSAEPAQYNERVHQIIQGFSEGKTREQIAQEVGYKNYKSMDMYLRRHNFLWDTHQQTYIPASHKLSLEELHSQASVPTKVANIQSLFREPGADAQTIARQMGFRDYQELAQYMGSKGFRWSGEKGNYVFDSSRTPKESPTQSRSPEPQTFETFLPLLTLLESHQERLTELLLNSFEAGQIPRYGIPGILTTKSIHMSHLLDRLSREFSREKNISQRDLFEVALVQFFLRYGFEKEIQELLHS